MGAEGTWQTGTQGIFYLIVLILNSGVISTKKGISKAIYNVQEDTCPRKLCKLCLRLNRKAEQFYCLYRGVKCSSQGSRMSHMPCAFPMNQFSGCLVRGGEDQPLAIACGS